MLGVFRGLILPIPGYRGTHCFRGIILRVPDRTGYFPDLIPRVLRT